MKIAPFGWGFAIRRYLTGGLTNPITWCWQLTLYWMSYKFRDSDKGIKGWWWHHRCFYSAHQYPANAEQTAEYLTKVIEAYKNAPQLTKVL